MSTEIRLTPIPAAEHTSIGDHEEIELMCHECETHAYAEGVDLDGLAARIDEWHRTRHEGGTP